MYKITGDLSKGWLVCLLMIEMFWFFGYMICMGNRGSKGDKQECDNLKEKNKQDKEE